MGRKKKIEYERTPFAIRITELQDSKKYSDAYVIHHLVDKNDYSVINDVQTLNAYKIGKRLPKDMISVVCAFADFYHVSTDYLLGYDDVPNREVAKVNAITGLSTDAINALITFKNSVSYDKNIHALIDALISGTTAEDMTHYYSLYNQLYEEYKDELEQVSDSSYDLIKLRERFMLTQSMYNYWKATVMPKLIPFFKKQMATEQDVIDYQHSDEYIQEMQNAIDSFPDTDYILKNEDNTQTILSAERHK